MAELDLKLEMQKGDYYEHDISCDSKFMLGIMDDLGNSTQITYQNIGVVYEEIIFIVVVNNVVNA